MESIVQVSQCDIDFWTQQITEHTLFLFKLLNPTTVVSLRNESKEHYSSWYNLLKSNPITYDPILLSSLFSFLENIRTKIKMLQRDSPPITIDLSIENFNSLIDHMILEQTYFSRLVEGKITVKDELLFWALENAEHDQLVSNLLQGTTLGNQIGKISDQLKQNYLISIYNYKYFPNEISLIKNSNNTIATIHNFVHSGQITNINDAMLEHEIRESKKGEERVQYLLSLMMF